MEQVTVSSKMDRELYSKIKRYCEKENITASQLIKNLIENTVSNLVPINKSGMNRITYSNRADSFAWIIHFDDGETITVGEDLTPKFLENLSEEIESVLATRNSYLKKTNKESIPAPTNLKKMKGEK